jgi:tetratricopeptide (TPR) repeat protein
MVQNASRRAALKLQRHEDEIEWGVYAIAPLTGHRLTIREEGTGVTLLDEVITLTPAAASQGTLLGVNPTRLTIELMDAQGVVVLRYQEHQPQAIPLPEVAKAPLPAAEIAHVDEAWFIGQHLEQYHHASRSPFDYYLRGVALDPLDYRCNLSLAMLEFNRADYARTVEYASQALKRAHALNKNPQCGQASLMRASAYERLAQWPEAEEDFWRAVWSGNSKAGGYYGLARLSARRGEHDAGLEFCRQSLRACPTNQEVLCLNNLLLVLSGRTDDARRERETLLRDYPLNTTLWWLSWFDERTDARLNAWRTVCQGRDVNALITAGQLINWGMASLALEVLQALDCQRTLPLYMQASLLPQAERGALLARAREVFPAFVRFPNTLDEVAALERLEECSFARHLLACFYYNKRHYAKAVALWQRCVETEPDFADGWRGLAIHAWNKAHDAHEAARCLDTACRLSPQDARLLFERDLLDKLTGVDPARRLARLEANLDCALRRDDMTAELLNLWHLAGETQKAAEILTTRKFHPWEGGEGKITSQYILNHLLRGWQHLQQKQPHEAEALLQQALQYPENLSEGRLPGQTDNDIWFWLGICARDQGDTEQAENCFRLAATGDRTLSIHSYYNDQPLDYLFWQGIALKMLGENEASAGLFSSMARWAEQMAEMRTEADFFAVSRPDLLALYADTQQEHDQTCLLVAALAAAGLGDLSGYEQAIARLESINPAWPKAALFRRVMPWVLALVH